MLTIARMHTESVAYYESTVDPDSAEDLGPDAYYSEDGTRPATAWITARSGRQQAVVAEFLGTTPGAVVGGSMVQAWFNRQLAPGGNRLGQKLRSNGVPGFDLTFCAPKSVSLIWGMSTSESVRVAVDQAHARAVEEALGYLSEHAGYTRRAVSPEQPKTMVLDRVEALSGVAYEHRTSRAGDPHVHSHVLLSNRQVCADGKARSLDSKSLYHEARAAGMLYQSVLRSTLSETLGVEWAEVEHGCAEIAGLDDRDLLAEYSTRMREIDLWKAENGLDEEAGFARMGQKITRRTKDTDTPLEELREAWHGSAYAARVRGVIDEWEPTDTPSHGDAVAPMPEAVLAAVTAERSTFTRADLVEKTAEMMPAEHAAGGVQARVEAIVDEIITAGSAWSVNPDAARSYSRAAREGSQRFTTQPVVEEVNHGIDLATARVEQGVQTTSIMPITGKLSVAQARAMRSVVASPYRASVVMAPAGAGKTSSLKAARRAFERAGRTVVGLAPTGKAADVMVGEQVAHSSSTIARALVGTEGLSPSQIAAKVGWNSNTVLVVDEAGMVATPDAVRLLEVAAAADARAVFVGDAHQYAAVKARSGMLATLAHELPDAVELAEVFRQKDAGERRASQWLRHGDRTDATRAADWYATRGRLHAGSTSAMLNDALAAWVADTDSGYESLLVAATKEDVEALNLGAQQVRLADGAIEQDGPQARLQGAYRGRVGDVILTRKNDYDLDTSTGDVVRNGQRWQINQIHHDGGVTATRLDEAGARVELPGDYVGEHVQLGYASTGHAAQGATVDTCHVVAGVGQVDRAGVYVPMTRGKVANHLYLTESQPGDPDTAHHHVDTRERRESVEYARDLLVQAASRDRSDVTPHQVWRGARRDFELARLSSNQRTDVSPFEGTRMAQVMADRQAKRRQRCDDFYRSQTKKAQPAARQTPGQVVQASLSERPLADMPDQLLTRLVADPEQVRGEYAQAGRDHHDLTQRRDAAETARARREELSSTSDRLNEELTQVCDRRAEVTRVIAREDNRSLWAKMLGGQGVKRQAHQDLAELDARRDSIRAQLQQLDEKSSQQREIISAAPTEQEENLSRHRVEDLRQAVDALETPEVIQAEATWRESADPKVAAVDRRRREPDLPPLAGDVMGSVYADQSDTWLAHALQARQQQSSGTSSVEQSVPPPTPGRDLDDGMGL